VGPESASGVDVVEYYTEHGDAALWQAVLAGFAIVCFVWFPATFAEATSASAVLVSAGVVAAVYLVGLGAWEGVAEN
jgi:predicted phage tail protein